MIDGQIKSQFKDLVPLLHEEILVVALIGQVLIQNVENSLLAFYEPENDSSNTSDNQAC